MLPKKYRVITKQIPDIVRRGRKHSNDYFDIRLKLDENFDNSKFTFIVSKKIVAKAVNRNLVKRRLRAAVWKLIKEDFFSQLGDYVFIVRANTILELTSEELTEQIKQTI